MSIVSAFNLHTRQEHVQVYVSPEHPDYEPGHPVATIPSLQEMTAQVEFLDENGLLVRYDFVVVTREVRAEIVDPRDVNQRLRNLRDEINRMLGEDDE